VTPYEIGLVALLCTVLAILLLGCGQPEDDEEL
jgi:hypothetical protein